MATREGWERWMGKGDKRASELPQNYDSVEAVHGKPDPHDVHVLIPGNCECSLIVLMAPMIQGRIFKWGDYPG